MKDPDPELEKLIKIMEKGAPLLLQLPEAPVIISEKDLYWEKKREVRCLGCDTYKYIKEFKSINTGYIKAFDPLCSYCAKQTKDTSYLVCVKCKTVVSRMKPHKDTSGFVFEANKAYHLSQCPACDANCNSSTVAEKVIYDKKYKQ